MKKYLEEKNIELVLIYGDGDSADRSKGDLVDIEWGVKIKNRIISILERRLYWQNVFSHIKRGDLVIVEQASRLIINYILQILSSMKYIRLAYWGHGVNYMAKSDNDIAEIIKRKLITKVDWWFAYNQATVKIVESAGYPRNKITDVQNSIDVDALREGINSVSFSETESLKKILEIDKNSRIILYIGGLYQEKGIVELIEASKIVNRLYPDTILLIVGSGPLKEYVKQEERKSEHIRFAGPLFGRDKIVALKIADVIAMYDAVGLVALDSLTAGVPIITTEGKNHGPEIEYLINGKTSIITNYNLESFADGIIRLIKSKEELDNMKMENIRESYNYSMVKMVNNFGGGIEYAIKYYKI
ncbi:glycosyltransferase family 4 protein [Deinococcus sp. UR1]|uniref:glycosyltransferase family 4 protein n=1 Tax=Deinococcus sp. UR1 TaxID=1704277 RepID=UPI0011AF4EEB|nr:glycosyltransferase family 4 protein [Deinococcus sp. UR1]